MIEKFSRMKYIADQHKVVLCNLNILMVKLEQVEAASLLNDIGANDYKGVGIGIDLSPKIIKNGDTSYIYFHNVGALEDIATAEGMTYYEKLVRDIEKVATTRKSSIVEPVTADKVATETLTEDDSAALEALKSSISASSPVMDEDIPPEDPKPPPKITASAKKSTAPVKSGMPSDAEIKKNLETAMSTYEMIMINNIVEDYKGVDHAQLLTKIEAIVEAHADWEYRKAEAMVFKKI